MLETSRWKKPLLHSQWSPAHVPGHKSWSERIRVDMSEKEGNRIEEPNRSIRGWRGVKDRHCQGLPTVKWNQFLWVEACQVEGSLNRQLHCGTNQQKLTELLVSEFFCLRSSEGFQLGVIPIHERALLTLSLYLSNIHIRPISIFFHVECMWLGFDQIPLQDSQSKQ